MSEIRKQLRTYASSYIYFGLNPEETLALRELLDTAQSLDLCQQSDFDALKLPFEKLVKSDEVRAIVDHEVNTLADNDRYVPSGSSGTTMLLAESSSMVLTATILEERHAASASIYSPAGNAWFGNLGPEEFTLCLHRRADGSDITVFDKAQVIKRQPSITLAVGDIVAISATEDVPEYRCKGQSLILKLTSRVYQPLIWVYDKVTGTPTMASAGNLHSSRMQMMLRTLAALESASTRDAPDPRSIESVLALCRHDFHFVRWGALQALCGMDFNQGKQALLTAVADPHPHVAHAARSSVAKLRQQGLIS